MNWQESTVKGYEVLVNDTCIRVRNSKTQKDVAVSNDKVRIYVNGKRKTVRTADLVKTTSKRKLNKAVADTIREMYKNGVKQKKLAEQFDVHQSTISEIVTNKLYSVGHGA